MNPNQDNEFRDPLRWQSALLEPRTVALIGASGDPTKKYVKTATFFTTMPLARRDRADQPKPRRAIWRQDIQKSS